MEKFEKQFKEATKHVSLSEADRALMRENLIEYMQYKPIRGMSTKPENSLNTKLLFPYFRAHHFSGAFLIAALIASSSFGVSYAAGDALPGDLLYRIKVNINEEIKTALLSDDESKINWERERAERRLVEASQLAAEGRLDEQKQEQVSKLFAEHTEHMVEQVRAVEESDPVFAAEMSSVFEDSLDVHEAVLARIIVETEDAEDGSARNLVEQVRTVSMEVEKIRNDVEAKIDIDESEETVPEEGDTEITELVETEVVVEDSTQKTDSANLRVRAAYRAQERAQELLTTVKELEATLDPESELAQQAQVQITFGENLVLKGDTALVENNLGDAYGKYRKASASFQKVIQLLEVAKLFSINIYPDKGVVEVDNGAELTEGSLETEDDELVQNLESTRAAIEEKISTARMLLLTQEGHNTEVAEKANSRIKDASAQMLRGEIVMVMKDYADAKSLFEQADKIISETVLSLENAAKQEEVKDIEVPVVVPPVVETPEKEKLTLTHSFENGVHTFTGVTTLPTPCHTLEQSVSVLESAPEQLHIDLSTKAPDPETMCGQVLQEVEFTVEAQASEQATLTQVRMNGVEQKWEMRKAENSSGEEQLQ